MKNAQPLFDSATHYRIEVRGRVDVDWLQSFDETNRVGSAAVLYVHTDQSGIVGLVRRLHGLGMTILQLQIVSDERTPDPLRG